MGGIPAAGKTTIARACRALGTSLGYPVYLNVKGLSRLQTVRAFLCAPLLWRFLYYALKMPLLAREKNESFLGHRWRSLLEARLYFAMLYEFTRRHPNSVVFLDQWMSRKLDVLTTTAAPRMCSDSSPSPTCISIDITCFWSCRSKP